MGNRWTSIATALAATCALVTTAPALAHPYASGLYSGTVRQAIPHTYAGTISFRIHRHKLTGLRFNVTMVCSKALIAQVRAPASKLKVRVARDGSFVYVGTVGGTKIKLHGRAHGHRAAGTFFESFRTAPGHRCSMLTAAPFHTTI